jgi:O-antigen chain-terminating methyltransferase
LTAIVNLPQIVRNINEYQDLTDAKLAGKADREAVDALHPILAGKADRGAAEEAHSLDAMYMSFADRFRGTRAEIGRKLRVYLPLIHTLGSKKEDLSILDVGCGRGEWLELLREEGYRVRGIDINRAAVQECRERGLDVTEADVIEHLQGFERGSLDVITGFHLIEHLPFPIMAALFDEAFAVLKPGGMIILETPNPTNILVSAYDFYRDPGHIRPLHPDTVNFIAENRGFVRTGAYFVSDAGADGALIKSTDWKLDDINDYIRAPRDFALIGYKP